MPEESSRGDFFAYWRTRIFQLSALWMLVVLIDRRIIRGKKWKVEKSWILLGIFMLLTVLSTVFSKHGSFAWNGIVENYEGGITILAYGIAFFYASQVIEEEKDGKLLLWALVFGTGVQRFFGLCQLAGHDFWSSSLGKMLAAPGQELFPYFVSWDSGFAILSGYLCYRSRKMWDIP